MPLDERVKETEHDVKEVSRALYQLIEAQKNTDKNVNLLTADMKKFMTAISSCDVVFERLSNLEKFQTALTTEKSWVIRLVGGMLIAAVVTALLNGGHL